MKIAAVIPARLQSTRFPRKILTPIYGLPMIEHVRRRALMCKMFSEVIVATCDEEIADVIRENSGRVIMTSDQHINGTSRVAEAVKQVDCSHVVLLQGDEPLLLPRHVEAMVKAIVGEPEVAAWNLVADLTSDDELDRHSFVKCSVAEPHKILYCFRRSPCFSEFEVQKKFVRKLLGVIAYKKDFLSQLEGMPVSTIELAESIEQMRIIENGFQLSCVEVYPSLPSVNETFELQDVLNILSTDSEQKTLLNAINY